MLPVSPRNAKIPKLAQIATSRQGSQRIDSPCPGRANNEHRRRSVMSATLHLTASPRPSCTLNGESATQMTLNTLRGWRVPQDPRARKVSVGM